MVVPYLFPLTDCSISDIILICVMTVYKNH